MMSESVFLCLQMQEKRLSEVQVEPGAAGAN